MILIKYLILIIFVQAVHGQSTSDTLRLTILHTNNNNGYIKMCDCSDHPMGGLDRRKYYFDQVRHSSPYSLTLDAGDFLDAFGFSKSQDKMVIRLYEQLGYDAVTVGDQEWVNGADFFNSHIIVSKLPLVSSTVKEKKTEETRIAPYVIKNIGGVRIGITGFLPAASFAYFPKGRKLETQIENEIEKLKKHLDLLAGKSDMIVLLSQAGYTEDFDLAKSFPIIDVIIGAHSQQEITEKTRVGKTIIVQAGGNGILVGKLDLKIVGKKIIDFENALIPMDQSMPQDSGFGRWIEDFENKK